MTIQEAESLIKTNEIKADKISTWADLGCGSGLFTNALATMLHTQSTIYAIDKNIAGFENLTSFAAININLLKLNFEKDNLPLQNLDGILMANSLHFVKNKMSFIEKLKNHFGDNGSFLIVEYDMETANPWVPYPVSFLALKELFINGGFSSVQKISERPSSFRRANLYSSLIKF